MAKQGLRSVVVKKYNHHASHGTVPDDKENILKRDFGTETINKKWCTDITYIHVQKEGWTYLASVMDLCSRKIIGYAYGTSMTAELAVEAVKNACLNVRETRGIILHSDLGSQYTSQSFEKFLNSREIRHSFSRKGNPYDNAYRELFRLFYARLGNLAFHFVEERAVAEDIVQDILYELWTKKLHFENFISLKVYLYRMVRSRCLDILKHRKVEKKYFQELRHKEDSEFFLHQFLEDEQIGRAHV